MYFIWRIVYNRSKSIYFFPSAIVVTSSESCVDVILPTDVISVTSVVLGISRRTIGTDNVLRFRSGSLSVLPSIHARASGPSRRINAYKKWTDEKKNEHPIHTRIFPFKFHIYWDGITCSSASFSSRAFRNRQLFVLTSRSRCSSSQTDESRRFFDIGRSVARIRLSTAPCGLRFISSN